MLRLLIALTLSTAACDGGTGAPEPIPGSPSAADAFIDGAPFCDGCVWQPINAERTVDGWAIRKSAAAPFGEAIEVELQYHIPGENGRYAVGAFFVELGPEENAVEFGTSGTGGNPFDTIPRLNAWRGADRAQFLPMHYSPVHRDLVVVKELDGREYRLQPLLLEIYYGE